jgi:hypothetical protein
VEWIGKIWQIVVQWWKFHHLRGIHRRIYRLLSALHSEERPLWMPNFMNNFAACCEPPEAVFGWRLSKQSGRSLSQVVVGRHGRWSRQRISNNRAIQNRT